MRFRKGKAVRPNANKRGKGEGLFFCQIHAGILYRQSDTGYRWNNWSYRSRPQQLFTIPDSVTALLCLEIIMPPLLIGGGIKRCFCLTSVWRLSVAYIGNKSRTERPRKTKIGTQVAHVTRDSDTTFKVKRSMSPGRFTHRGLNASGSCSGERWNVLGVGNYCYVVCSAALGASAPTNGGKGRGISWRPPAYSLLCPRPVRVEALSDAFVWRLTSVWRLSVAYIGE